jgi:hypothetical protein
LPLQFGGIELLVLGETGELGDQPPVAAQLRGLACLGTIAGAAPEAWPRASATGGGQDCL